MASSRVAVIVKEDECGPVDGKWSNVALACLQSNFTFFFNYVSRAKYCDHSDYGP
jgi:hypothetical protein